MELEIKLSDLPCYKTGEIQEGSLAYKNRNRCFRLDTLPTKGLQQVFYDLIWQRGTEKKATTIRSDLTEYHVVSAFLTECYPKMENLLEIPWPELEKRLRKWLLKMESHLQHVREVPGWEQKSSRKVHISGI